MASFFQSRLAKKTRRKRRNDHSLSFKVVDRSMQMHGGLGVAKDLPLERWFREMRIRRIGEGPNEVQRHIIARELLGPAFR